MPGLHIRKYCKTNRLTLKMTIWAKPEVNRSAYDLFYLFYYEDFGEVFFCGYVKCYFLSVSAFYLYSLLNLEYDRPVIHVQFWAYESWDSLCPI